MINHETELDLSWSKDCTMSKTLNNAKVPANSDASEHTEGSTTDATFEINSAKLYFPVVTLSINVNIKFFENLNQGFKRIVSWNKYGSEITAQLPKKIWFL